MVFSILFFQFLTFQAFVSACRIFFRTLRWTLCNFTPQKKLKLCPIYAGTLDSISHYIHFRMTFNSSVGTPGYDNFFIWYGLRSSVQVVWRKWCTFLVSRIVFLHFKLQSKSKGIGLQVWKNRVTQAPSFYAMKA